MALIDRLAGAGRLDLATIAPLEAPAGLAAELAHWRHLGLPVEQDEIGRAHV